VKFPPPEQQFLSLFVVDEKNGKHSNKKRVRDN
jgi:hypothetical protein